MTKLTISEINNLRNSIEEAVLSDYPKGLTLPERMDVVEKRLNTALTYTDLTKMPEKEDLTQKK